MTVKRALLLVVLAALLVSGCGGDSSDETTTASNTSIVSVYFLRDGKVWPVAREVDETDVLTASVDELRGGPTEQEQTDLDLTTAIPESEDVELSRAALAQLVYTMTQFAGDDSAEINGVNYTRADFEDQTPPVLVESPLPFEEVESPLRVTGTANTFEATFNYELTDTDGLIVDENFVTATSGTGTRGTFDFTTGPFTVPFDGVGSLIVFELSAKDGSRIHVVEIPLRMEK